MDKIVLKHNRSGVALLVILFIVMTVAVISMGFIARSDVELSCGVNMILKSQMDNLAQSGLEHAKGIILTPQDVSSEYWAGGSDFQLDSSSDDYYDISVSRTGYCDYQIQSEAYRLSGEQQVGISKLKANLRLDPCIALRTGDNFYSYHGVRVNGDSYINGWLSGYGSFRGDVKAKRDIYCRSNITGSATEDVEVETVPFPDLDYEDFQSSYYIESSNYNSRTINSSTPIVGSFWPSSSNPAGVLYCEGDLTIGSYTSIYGCLVVHGDLIINGTNICITAKKNFPALIVTGRLKLVTNSKSEINGLVQVGSYIEAFDGYSSVYAYNVDFTVNGSVFIENHFINGFHNSSNSLVFNACPDKAAIELWDSDGSAFRWNCAGGAFYKSIERY